MLGDGDRCFSSKGHDAPGTYAVLAGTEKLGFELVHGLRRAGGLPGHPDVVTHPVVQTSTGSLGMGVSKAKGFVLADRLEGRTGRVYVITGDGELQEGQFWESLAGAANRGMGEITVIVDHNKLQSDTWVDQVSDLGDLEAKAAAWGWATARCDGHDLRALDAALRDFDERAGGRPRFLVADTLKGAGVSFMEPHELPHTREALYGYHSGAPSTDEYERAVGELRQRLDRRWRPGCRPGGAGARTFDRRGDRAGPALRRGQCRHCRRRRGGGQRRADAVAANRSDWWPPTARRWPQPANPSQGWSPWTPTWCWTPA